MPVVFEERCKGAVGYPDKAVPQLVVDTAALGYVPVVPVGGHVGGGDELMSVGVVQIDVSSGLLQSSSGPQHRYLLQLIASDALQHAMRFVQVIGSAS